MPQLLLVFLFSYFVCRFWFYQDVVAFFLNPGRCVFGESADGTALEFIRNINNQTIKALYSDALLPVIVDLIFAGSGLDALETLFQPLCDIIDTILSITGATSGIKGVVDAIDVVVGGINTVVDESKDLVKDVWDSIFGRRSLQSLDTLSLSPLSAEVAPCTGHLNTCSNDDTVDCTQCIDSRELTNCGTCRTCYQPIGSIDGVCLSSTDLRHLLNGEASYLVIQEVHTALLAQHIEKVADENVVAAFNKALGTDGASKKDLAHILLESVFDLRENVVYNVEASEMRILSKVEEAQQAIRMSINEQCPRETEPKTRRLGEPTSEEEKEEIKKAAYLDDVKMQVAEKGVDGSAIDKTFDMLVDGLVESASKTRDLEEKLKEALTENPALGELEKLVMKDIEERREELATETAARFLKTAVDPGTKKINTRKLLSLIDLLGGGSGSDICSEIFSNSTDLIKGKHSPLLRCSLRFLAFFISTYLVL